MTTDDSRKVFDRWKESNLLIERDDFGIILAEPVCISRHLLCPGDHEAEKRSLTELRDFRCLRRRKNLRLQTDRLEMPGRPLCEQWIGCTHKFGVPEEILKHPRVFSTYRTVRHGRSRSLANSSGRSDCYCAVDDRQSGIELPDISRGFTDKIINLEREADMEHIDIVHLLRGRRR